MIRNAYAYFGFGAVVAAGVAAAYVGLTPEKPDAPVVTPPKAVEKAVEQPAVPTPAIEAPKPAEAPAVNEPSQIQALAPSFDILRVEPRGDIVIAGKAAPNSNVDVISGSTVLGSANAGVEGDFAIVLDKPLEPGDYQLVLRSTAENGTVMTSIETAVVSIPDNEKGQVLALVEQAGAPSRMITTPKPTETPAASEKASEQPPAVASESPAATTQPADNAPVAKAPVAQPAAKVTVEAVEIEGNTVFVAGAAPAGKRINIYANDKLLGSTIATPDGRFLVQTEQALTVGDYIIRADMTEPNSTEVIGRAAVPFHREEGQNIAAVAPSTPQTVQPSEEAPVSTAAGAEPKDDTIAPPLEKVDGSVIIRRGDTLWTISRRVYGRGIRYTTIYLANSDQIKDPNKIWPGQVFSLPEKPNKTLEQGG